MIKKILFVLFIFSILTAASAVSVWAGPSENYIELIKRTFGTDFREMPVAEVDLKSLSLERQNTGSGGVTFDYLFHISGQVDYLELIIKGTRIYWPGKMVLSINQANSRKIIYSRDTGFPRLTFVDLPLGAGDYSLSLNFVSPGSLADDSFDLKAYRYLTLSSGSDSTGYLLPTSVLRNLSMQGQTSLKNVNGLVICDDTERFTSDFFACDASAVYPSNGSLTFFNAADGAALAVTPRLNNNLLVISPRIFKSASGVDFLKSYLSSRFDSSLVRLSEIGRLEKSLSVLAGSVTYAGWVGLPVLLILVLFYVKTFVGVKRTALKILFSLNRISSLGAVLSRTVLKLRPLFLTVLAGSLIALFVLRYSAVVSGLKTWAPFYALYYLTKESLGFSLSSSDLKEISEMFLVGISILSLMAIFLDKVIVSFVDLFRVLEKERTNGPKALDVLVLVLLPLGLAAELLLGESPVTASLFLLILFLLAFDLAARAQELIEVRRVVPELPRLLKILYLLLILSLFGLTVFKELNYNRSIFPFSLNRVKNLPPPNRYQFVLLPSQIRKPGFGQSYAPLWARSSDPLLVGDNLVTYPGGGQIDYSSNGAAVPASSLVGKKVALYFSSSGSFETLSPASLGFLGGFVGEKNFAPGVSGALLHLNHDYSTGESRYLFYAYLSGGDLSFTLNYLDLNQTPFPRSYRINVYSLDGQPVVSSARLELNTDSVLNQPALDTVSLGVNLESNDVYLVEVLFDEENTAGWVGDSTFLESISFPSGPIFLLAPKLLGPSSLASSADYWTAGGSAGFNPFIFDLVPFGNPAEVILSFDSSLQMSLNSSDGWFNLGEVLNRLNEQKAITGAVSLRSLGVSNLLILSKDNY
ncbi:MAG: hypothetical protein M1352_03025 [Patescibacteria group bacterium]|nr:hypothetical protein [Patescibacteria group bacterium]